MAPKKPQDAGSEIQIMELERGRISTYVVGTTPLICNRVSTKAKRELVLPRGKKNATEKAQTLKHNPLDEYRNSPYTVDEGPTLLAALAVWFKKGMMTAALELPGVKKAQIGRLVRVEGERLPLYGTPEMLMAITRSADMNRTPDVRTRAVVREWMVPVDVTFAKPTLREKSIVNLFAAAGVFSGAGDWRTEKGAANYGSYRLAGADDPEVKKLLKIGRTLQTAALNTPAFYDDETDELYKWYVSEVAERGHKVEV